MKLNANFDQTLETLINSSKALANWFEENQGEMTNHHLDHVNCSIFLPEDMSADLTVLAKMADECLYWLDKERELSSEEKIKKAIDSMSEVYEEEKDKLSPDAKKRYCIGTPIKKVVEEPKTIIEPVLKNKYDVEERKKIQSFCRNFSRYSFPKDITVGDEIKEEVLRPYFLRSLEIFKSSLITDYFSARTKNLKVIKSKGCTSEKIKLLYKNNEGRPISLKLVIPSKKLTMDDQIAYAHEIGHIPGIELSNEKYIEYGEVLPMFLEFVTDMRRQPRFDAAFDKFLFGRLPYEQEVARDMMKMLKDLGFSKKKISPEQRMIVGDWYSFIESLEYAIQLIYVAKDDMEAVTEELEGLLAGKTLEDVAKNLGIETEGCKMLQKEYKRVGRM